MRIYDFSKKFDVSVKNVVSALKERGVRRAEPDFLLADSHVAFLKRRFHVRDEKEVESCAIVSNVSVPEKEMFLGQLADLLERPASELIIMLLKQGVVANKNQLLGKEVVVSVAQSYGATLVAEEGSSEIAAGRVQDSLEEEEAVGQSRAPIVAVVGHVDHGKTTLLDTIRKTRVASGEVGGITQSVGAYSVDTSHGRVVFIDTPGHEAFSVMRERGVRVADIVALIVAADDGVKPQTIECIKAVQELQVPMIVLLNKIDKVDATRIETVKRQLAEQGVLSDDWGGEIPFVGVSAKNGDGIAEMLDLLALQADMLHLSANVDVAARGYVLESHVQRGRGPVASLILHCGILKIGDFFVCGNAVGKVSSMVDSYGKQVKKAGPSESVMVAGFSELPSAGDLLKVASQADAKKHKGTADIQASSQKHDMSVEAINVIVKAGSFSSKDALVQAIEKIKIKGAHPVRIIEAGVGDISEGNIELAEQVKATIFGLDVKLERNASVLKSEAVIKQYNIIYRLLEDIEQLVKATKEPEYETRVLGKATVKAVFRIKSVGVVAGAGVEEGQIQKGEILIVYRGGKKIAEGKIKSLQREKYAAENVSAGHDCAFKINEFDKWQIGDEVECVSRKEINSI